MATVRTMISVPGELKHRMKKRARNINWSAIACRAFEAKLAEFESPMWRGVLIQRFEHGAAGDAVPAEEWIEDCRTTLGLLMTNCKEMWSDDPGFQQWYSDLRNEAGNVCETLDQLAITCARFLRPHRH